MGAPSGSSLVRLTLAPGLRECHTRMPEVFDDVGHCADAVLKRVGTRVVLAMPLGIGKPNPLANEFYRRARLDPAIDLTIVTALSLLKPAADRKSTRLNSSHEWISYAVFCLKKKKKTGSTSCTKK